MEAKFCCSHITSRHSQYDEVLAKLLADIISSIHNLVASISNNTANPYQLLKDQLLSIYSPSQWTLANQLLNFPPISNQRPSIMMDRMLALLPTNKPPSILFQARYLNRLP